MESFIWYEMLVRPSWAPPSYLFGPVWAVLYVIIIISFARVFWAFFKKEIPFKVLLPFILNLVFNFSFTYFQFELKNNFLASIDIVLVLATLIWVMVSIHKYFKWVAYVNIPYLLWVTFATVLQITITYLNR